MKTIAVFAAKGGVGKTSIAVNLAHAAAGHGGRRTLLWDLDSQGAATFLLRAKPRTRARARDAVAGELDLKDLVRETDYPNLFLLPADRSLRRIEADIARQDKAKQLRKLLKGLAKSFDRVVIDTPPGLTELSDRVLRAADLVVVPALPSPLSARAETQLAEELERNHGIAAPAILPVWSMVDRRKSLHRATIAASPERPLIPYAAAIENMSLRREPIAAAAPMSPAARAFGLLYTEVELALLRPGHG